MRAPISVVLFLVAGLFAASQSGNIIRLADAHPAVIAAWRLVIAAVLLAPLGGRRWGDLVQLGRRDRLLLVVVSAALASHFLTFIAAVQMTTVANALVFFAINPVFTATAGKLIYGERGGWPLVGSIGLGLVGVVVIGLGDFSLSPEHLPGDAMAVLCSALFTVYFLAGKQVRRSLDNRVYAPTIYGLAGLMCWALVPVLGLPAVDYDGRTWLAFGLMALVPTMIGHTSMNLALRYIDAGRISVLTLSEPIFAGLVAAWVWGEPMTVPTIVGYLLISSSVLVVMWDRGGSPWRGDSTAAPGDPSVAAGDADTG